MSKDCPALVPCNLNNFSLERFYFSDIVYIRSFYYTYWSYIYATYYFDAIFNRWWFPTILCHHIHMLVSNIKTRQFFLPQGYRFLTPYLWSEGPSGFPGSSQSALNESAVDVGALCPGWVAQPSSTATFQPLGHWAPPEYFQHEQSISTLPSLTSDMYVQPVCPSYAVVGPSSVLTLAHAPLFTNLGVSYSRWWTLHVKC